MERLMTNIRRLRSLLSAPSSHRVAATLCVLLIAFVTLAATTSARRDPNGSTYSMGSNMMLAPGQSGLAPALY